MIKGKLLANLIETKLQLGKESAKGFRSIKCEVCNDYKPRGGFNLHDNQIRYKCFNCNSHFIFHEGSTYNSKDARSILTSFGITNSEIDDITSSNYFNINKSETITLDKLKKEYSLATPEIQLPKNSFPIGSDHNWEIQNPIIEYLFSRQIDPLKIKAHFSTEKELFNRAIIPCYRNGKVIYWQARDITNKKKNRYMSPGISKATALWGYDNLWTNNVCLYITEGIFDAYHVDGIALIGSSLNREKIEIINKCKKRKIVVIDKDFNGGFLANLALSNNWEITYTDCGDINNSINTCGEIYTFLSLKKNIIKPSKNKIINVENSLKLNLELMISKLKEQ